MEVEIVCSICLKIQVRCEQAVVLALRALASLQHDLQSREAFRIRGGPSILVGILTNGFENIDILSNGFAVVVAAATSK
ncbi:hypothetical protein ACFX13_035425 [Malus domestica]